MPLLTLLNSSSSSSAGDLTLSRTVTVVPSQTYSLSMWFDPTNVTNNNVSPQMQMGIWKTDGVTVLQSMYLPLNCTVGRYTLPNWTCPGDGSITSVIIFGKLLSTATVTSGQTFKISQPMLQVV